MLRAHDERLERLAEPLLLGGIHGLLPLGDVVRCLQVGSNDSGSSCVEDPQTLRGSFSAVSRPIIASKYSFCCSSCFRDLQVLHILAHLRAQKEFSQTSANFLYKYVAFRPDSDEHD